MKKFLLLAAIFFIILAIGAYTLDFAVKKGLEKQETTWKKIFESKINSDVIILGNSRVCAHIDTKILDSVLNVDAYNLGMDGYTFNMQNLEYQLFEKYGNSKPRLLIQNADFNTLQRLNYIYDITPFYAFIHEPLLKKELSNFIGLSALRLSLPLISLNTKAALKGFAELFGLSHYVEEGYKGYKGQDLKWDGSGLAERLSDDSLAYFIDPTIVREMDEHLARCKANGIEVVLLFSPEYCKLTEYVKNKDEIFNIYRSFSEKYDFPFLDYSSDSLCYDTTYFFNAMHLNRTGAELFTIKLANDLKKYLPEK